MWQFALDNFSTEVLLLVNLSSDKLPFKPYHFHRLKQNKGEKRSKHKDMMFGGGRGVKDDLGGVIEEMGDRYLNMQFGGKGMGEWKGW